MSTPPTDGRKRSADSGSASRGASAETDLREPTKELCKMEKELEEAKKELEEAKEELENERNEHEEARETTAEVKETSERKISTLQAQLDSVRNVYNRANLKAIDEELRNVLDSVKEELENEQNEHEEARETAAEEKESLEKKIATIHAQLDSVRNVYNRANLKAIDQELRNVLDSSPFETPPPNFIRIVGNNINELQCPFCGVTLISTLKEHWRATNLNLPENRTCVKNKFAFLAHTGSELFCCTLHDGEEVQVDLLNTWKEETLVEVLKTYVAELLDDEGKASAELQKYYTIVPEMEVFVEKYFGHSEHTEEGA